MSWGGAHNSGATTSCDRPRVLGMTHPALLQYTTMFEYPLIRNSTRITCFDLEPIDWRTPNLVCQRCHGIHRIHSRDPRRGITWLLKRSEVGYSSCRISPTFGRDCLKAGRVRLSRVVARTMECLMAAL